MGVQNWSEHVVLVSLPEEPQTADKPADDESAAGAAETAKNEEDATS